MLDSNKTYSAVRFREIINETLQMLIRGLSTGKSVSINCTCLINLPGKLLEER